MGDDGGDASSSRLAGRGLDAGRPTGAATGPGGPFTEPRTWFPHQRPGAWRPCSDRGGGPRCEGAPALRGRGEAEKFSGSVHGELDVQFERARGRGSRPGCPTPEVARRDEPPGSIAPDPRLSPPPSPLRWQCPYPGCRRCGPLRAGRWVAFWGAALRRRLGCAALPRSRPARRPTAHQPRGAPPDRSRSCGGSRCITARRRTSAAAGGSAGTAPSSRSAPSAGRP
jgi:hypothetical protein